jgi:hypothetical protein
MLAYYSGRDVQSKTQQIVGKLVLSSEYLWLDILLKFTYYFSLYTV